MVRYGAKTALPLCLEPMRVRLVLALILATAVPATAQIANQLERQTQTQVGMPAQSFAFFRCTCNTTVGAPLQNQLSFAAPPVRLWNGNVYATTDRDAIYRAQTACTSERRGSLFDCVNCRCSK